MKLLLRQYLQTFRYFEPRHTFMSADSFHRQVEKSLKRMKKVYDFSDFVSCVQSCNSGKVDVKEMRQEDFFTWPNNSSIYKVNYLQPMPYLKNIAEVVANGCKEKQQYITLQNKFLYRDNI